MRIALAFTGAGPTGIEPATSDVTGRRSNLIELQPQKNRIIYDIFQVSARAKWKITVCRILVPRLPNDLKAANIEKGASI